MGCWSNLFLGYFPELTGKILAAQIHFWYLITLDHCTIFSYFIDKCVFLIDYVPNSFTHKLRICSHSLLSGPKHATSNNCRTYVICDQNFNMYIFSSIALTIKEIDTWAWWPSDSNSSGLSFTSSENFQTTLEITGCPTTFREGVKYIWKAFKVI